LPLDYGYKEERTVAPCKNDITKSNNFIKLYDLQNFIEDSYPPLRNQEQTNASFFLHDINTKLNKQNSTYPDWINTRVLRESYSPKCSNTSLASTTDDFLCFAKVHANAVT
jgi:hypothetical protein